MTTTCISHHSYEYTTEHQRALLSNMKLGFERLLTETDDPVEQNEIRMSCADIEHKLEVMK